MLVEIYHWLQSEAVLLTQRLTGGCCLVGSPYYFDLSLCCNEG